VEKGLVARVWNFSSQPETYQLTVKNGAAKAWAVTHTERDLTALPIAADKAKAVAKQHQIQTLRIEPKR
jgi:hypothetical protein